MHIQYVTLESQAVSIFRSLTGTILLRYRTDISMYDISSRLEGEARER